MKLLLRVCAAAIAHLFLISPATAQDADHPAIDGEFTDWHGSYHVAHDRSGDATGPFDLFMVSAQTSGSDLFIALQLVRPEVNLQNGPETDETLRLDLDMGEHGTLVIDFRRRTATLNKGDTIRTLSWSELGFVSLPTYANSRYEMRLSLDELGIETGDTVRLNFSGSDELEMPVEIAISQESVEASGDVSLDRADGAAFRIANLNTLRNGLADTQRGPAIKRLIDAVDADIFTFQGEWQEPLFRDGLLQAFDGEVNSVWSGGCAIVTKLDLQRLDMTLDRAVAGLVTLPDGEHVVIISVHFKSAGYTDSSEDNLRIQQAEQLVGEIKRMRDHAFGHEAMEAPVIVIGDFNLVGSRTPLNIIQSGGLTPVLLRSPGDGSAYTWRGLQPDSSFWPGRLDWVMCEKELDPLKTLILDTARIPEEQVNALRLQADDSQASDHLMLVADFRTRSPVDFARMAIQEIGYACKVYKASTGSYPQSLQDLITKPEGMEEGRWPGRFLSELPTDPWGNEYRYELSGDQPKVWSMGPDGQNGTADDVSGG